MEYIKNAALCLVFAAAAGTLATVIVPRGSMDKTLRAVVGIFVVAVICTPFANIETTDLTSEAFAFSDEENFENKHTEDMREYMINTVEETVALQIKEIASDYGVNVVSVNTDVFFDEENCINIHKIEAVIKACESVCVSDLSKAISERLGVNADVIAE